jgi:hypothetical protein
MNTPAYKKIYVVGYPKSGNTWLTRLLADVLHCPAGTGMSHDDQREIAIDVNQELGVDENNAEYKILKTHFLPEELVKRIDPDPRYIVYIKRDFRDVIISAYFMKYNKYNVKEDEVRYTGLFRMLRRGPVSAMRYCINRWRLWQYTRRLCHTWGKGDNGIGSWQEHIDKWHEFAYQHDNVRFAETTYEDMLQQPQPILQQIIATLGLPDPGEQRLHEAVSRQSFENKKQRLQQMPADVSVPKGKAFNVKFMRKGMSGDWRNFFSAAMAQEVQRYMGEALVENGYEVDASWCRLQ